MTRPSVVHVVVAGDIGGAERMLAALAAHHDLTRARHAVALLAPDERLGAMFRGAGLRVHEAHRAERCGATAYLRTSLGSRSVGWIASVLAAERAQIVHLHTVASQVVGTRAALRTAGARILRTEHSTRAFDDPTCWPFTRWSLARADASVAVSAHVRLAAVSRAPWAADKAIVVHDGVDTDRFTPRGDRASDGSWPTFAVVARLEPRKGVDLAIRAVARLPSVRLEVAGDGAERRRLERLAYRCGVAARVRFWGALADPRPVFETADAVVCPSRSEGLGVALLEGMAMGRPVVGFAVGGVPEIVQHARTGLLADGAGPDALAAVIGDAVRAGPDALRALGRAARAVVVERFSVGAMCAGYADAYERLGSTAGRKFVPR